MMENNGKLFSFLKHTQKNPQKHSVRGTLLFFFSPSSYNIKMKILYLYFL